MFSLGAPDEDPRGRIIHPSVICCLYSVYMQRVFLVPNAGVFLAEE